MNVPSLIEAMYWQTNQWLARVCRRQAAQDPRSHTDGVKDFDSDEPGVDLLLIPPSNHLEALERERAGQWSVRINDPWRLCFRFESGVAHSVEIVDYH